MKKTKILITGGDMNYLKALARRLELKDKSISAEVMSPERIESDRDNLKERYSLLLAEEECCTSERFRDFKVIILSDKREAASDSNIKTVFKFQNINSLIQQLRIRCPWMNRNKEGLKLVCLTGRIPREQLAVYASFLAGCLASELSKVLLMNLEEFGREPFFRISEKGRRTWDDLIFCSVYGKTGDILPDISRYASSDENGTLLFEEADGRNPYHLLDSDEIDLFFSRLRQKTDFDYLIGCLPETSGHTFSDTIMNCYTCVILNDGTGESVRWSEAFKASLKTSDIFAGQQISVCTDKDRAGFRYDDLTAASETGITVRSANEIRQTQMWKDMIMLAGLIKNERS